MAKAGEYTINEIYQGGASSLDPEGGLFTGYRDSSGNLGMGSDARTANVLQEISNKISTGARTIELNQVFPEVFNAIPKQQLEEVRRVSKLTGVDMTFHAPIVGLDPSGMDKQGNFSDTQMEMVQREMVDAVKRGQVIKPEGGLPIVFHAAEGVPETYPDKAPEGSKEVFVVNTENNSMIRLPLERDRYLIGGGKGEPVNQDIELRNLNDTEWSNSLANLGVSQHQIDQVVPPEYITPLLPLFTEYKKGEPINAINENQKAALEKLNQSHIFVDNAEATFNTLFNKAYRHGDEQTRKDLKKISDYWVKESKNMIEDIQKAEGSPLQQAELILRKKDLLKKVTHGYPEIQLKGLANIEAPKIYKPVNEFAKERSAKTFGDVAFETWEKFKDKSPIIAIENSYAGGAFSTGEGLKEVVELSKNEFVKNAVESGKLSESEAKKQADKIIGATWDTGRINSLRKHGFTKEEIIEETKKIAPLVKHVHLSDNFGMDHSELPMGMGNAPIKEMMEKLGEEGYEGKKVVEALSWWQHFKTPPMKETLEAFGSPIYSGAAPSLYWNQAVGLQQGYLSGYGQMLPQINYNTFGAGFSQLPQELGGQAQGAQGGRMSGRPME